MDSKDIENVLSITEMVMRFGIPLVIDVVKTIQEKSPTIADIHNLKLSLRDPESYFGGAKEPKIIDEIK